MSVDCSTPQNQQIFRKVQHFDRGIVVNFLLQISAKQNSFARDNRIERVVFYSIVGENFGIVEGKFGYPKNYTYICTTKIGRIPIWRALILQLSRQSTTLLMLGSRVRAPAGSRKKISDNQMIVGDFFVSQHFGITPYFTPNMAISGKMFYHLFYQFQKRGLLA